MYHKVLAWKYRIIKVRVQELLESFRFKDEDDYKYKIFSILSIVWAKASIILVRMSSWQEQVIKIIVRGFITLGSGEGLTFPLV